MTAPKTWADNAVVSAADLNGEIRDRFNAIGSWVSYAPTWAATGGTPSVGNGTLTGYYRTYGDVCDIAISLTLGSSSSMTNTTAWTFSLPVTPAASFTAAAVCVNTGAAWYPCATVLSTTVLVVACPDGSFAGYQKPFTWDVGDYLRINGTYRV